MSAGQAAYPPGVRTTYLVTVEVAPQDVDLLPEKVPAMIADRMDATAVRCISVVRCKGPGEDRPPATS